MLIELMALEIILRKWKEDPKLATQDMSPYSGDEEKTEQHALKQIEQMKSYQKKHNPNAFTRLFPEAV